MTFELVLPMHPWPQPRPRATIHGTYVPKWAREARLEMQAHMVRLTVGQKPLEGQIALEIGLFRLPAPIRGGACPVCTKDLADVHAHMTRQHPQEVPTTRDIRRDGDIDNYMKAVLDAGNGVLWDDDRQIWDLHGFFDESAEPRVELTVGEPQK